jgi:uncharacterized membrane protein
MKIYKISIPKSVILITILAVVLNILRVVFWKKWSFFYILWNILLAFIPFFISLILLSLQKEGKLNKVIFVTGFILWMIFIPNAPYIITDFIHLGEVRAVPMIYDTFLIFSSASVGLILCFYSFFHMEQIIRTKYSQRKTSLLMGIIILFVSFGIYLGRFLRFNSWDVFMNHTTLTKNVWGIFSQSTVHTEVYFYTVLFFFFLYLTYSAWKQANIK